MHASKLGNVRRMMITVTTLFDHDRILRKSSLSFETDVWH